MTRNYPFLFPMYTFFPATFPLLKTSFLCAWSYIIKIWVPSSLTIIISAFNACASGRWKGGASSKGRHLFKVVVVEVIASSALSGIRRMGQRWGLLGLLCAFWAYLRVLGLNLMSWVLGYEAFRVHSNEDFVFFFHSRFVLTHHWIFIAGWSNWVSTVYPLDFLKNWIHTIKYF